MFDRSADLYDAFYDALGKDYRTEADDVLRIVRDRVTRPASLLDVACGTGRHLAYFARRLRCAGVDINPELLATARRRCPAVWLAEADMVDFDLGETYDAVTCLFSAIGYVRTVPRLRRAVAAMARHVASGGVLIVEPWFQPEQWDTGHLAVLVSDEPDRKAARTSRSSRRGDLAILDFDYLVADRRGVRHFTERHELRLFRWRDYRDAFERAGLTTEIDRWGLTGRGLIIGRAAEVTVRA
jgi:SAM-dependent methyltransferase